ncbi:MAG: bifunctional folylpolyglutamate synthase/dihydrofolate synthase [Anaerolineales bacterium]|nr:bifunctional folylpolyglutamate synthase/dihydrofolate synthase [Anaerolineales bacterium]
MNLSYPDAITYLNHFLDHSKTHAANLVPENFDLRRVHTLLAALGDPHRAYPVIHIAGTKGKGSTAAFCAAALQSAGYRTGLYTSPHLEDYSERFQIDRVPVSHEVFAMLVKDIQPSVAEIPHITSFEIEAALAFWYFAREKVQVAVIEVGMGGRLDATNVVTPLVSVITTISLDHVPILGTTLAEIAGEKAGIIKKNHPVVCGPQPNQASDVIHAIARERQSPLIQVGDQVTYTERGAGLERQTIEVVFSKDEPVVLKIPLLGPHQVENAATAYAALRVAQSEGLKITEAAICNGFASVTWPGRFEILTHTPVPLILDGAHNQDSARRLRETLDQYYPSRPTVLIFGVSGDKNVREILAELHPIHAEAGEITMLIATQSTHARAMPTDQLVAQAQEAGYTTVAAPSVQEALTFARNVVPSNGLILVTGSIFVAGEARTVLRESI